ncbi:beta-ketoacyl synthase N-terminal-like domain-containing protein [Streptomyces sp. NPDC005865]|uniref:beta-ketoacyl synthase N-terminal-like domain-containing protein n=1 Tax=Streptomyces sp. NPDC005865 TaxID=3155453 RepID=UPI0033F759D9
MVGMACRLPGAADPAAFWRLLSEGRDAVRDAPPERRRADSGLRGPGGYLDRIDGFDAAFFRVSPREAVAMDPQQRLLLELSWEALEDAGIRPAHLARSRTGVFVGAFWDDYAHVLDRGTEAAVTRHTMTGVHRSILANRISYTYGLAGPSLTVDTAQSSSLVAVHLACESIRGGESETAFAGGVSLICSPHSTELAEARFGGLSATGRCHTFDARADGFVRGEGGGLVVLKSLAAARRDGDTVYCVIRGSAVNSDGATDGLTRPSGQAQRDVVRLACRRAGVTPDRIQYVELHGTGTPVGDPVEAAALGAALGQDGARTAPLAVGSAKTNVGHLEAAAGVVGLLKTALSIHHRRLAPSLNFTDPNPAIPLTDLGLRVQREPAAWPHPEEPLTAGVSSFGMGGTNCHVVLAEAPGVGEGGGAERGEGVACASAEGAMPAAAGGAATVSAGAAASEPAAAATAAPAVPAEGGLPGPDGGVTAGRAAAGSAPAEMSPGHTPVSEALRAAATASAPAETSPGDAPRSDNPRVTATTPPTPWPVSAHSGVALRAQAGRLRDHLRGLPDAPDPSRVGHALARTRTPLAHRAVLLGGDTDGLLGSLDALAAGADTPSVVRGEADGDGKVAFLFSGQGAQRAGMGRDLYAAFPVFAHALDEAFAALDGHLDHPLREIVLGEDPARLSLLDRTAYTQPALFAIETSLYRLVESFGLRPDYVLGHSVGEITAAHVAGALSLSDASALVAARGRLMQTVRAPGAMAAWQGSPDEVAELLAGQEEHVTLAAVNGPDSVVISGDRDTVDELTATWRARGRKAHRLKVSHAFHSPHMDPVLDELRAVAARLTFSAPTLSVISNITGRPVSGAEYADPEYWARHARQPVQFLSGIRELCEAGVTTFVELGPDAPLSAMARACFPAPSQDPSRPRPAAVAVCRRGRDEATTFMTALAQAYVRGADVDFTPAYVGFTPAYVDRTSAYGNLTPAYGDLTPAYRDRAEAGGRLSLPTYAFQRERYWPDGTPETSEVPEATDEAEAGGVTPATGGARAELAGRLATLTVADQERTLLGLVAHHVAAVLGSGSGTVETARTFKQLGFDSMAAAELSERLGSATGLPLPATLTFDHPTPLAVAAHLRAEVIGTPTPAATATTPPAPTRDTAVDEDPVVIVAMSCRYPGGATSPEDLWRLVADGADAVGAFPTDRGWDLERLFHPDADRSGTSSTRQGGFLYDAADFDAEFFDISPREALAVDPQQRLLLECAWEAFERAGLDPRTLKGSPTGVFVGMTGQDYGPRLHEPSQSTDGYLLTGSTPSVASGRLSFSFGLEGPALTVDTACSSSLVTLHLAAQALRNGECELALAGGATVLATPGMFTEFSRQRGLAPDGRCKPFAEGADGTGWAEGVGLVLLERLSAARRNGHRVLAAVRGSAINQDGASNGLTAPNGPSQQRVIRAALADARLAADEVDVVEAHGTGTTLGDPIEAQALLATYGRGRGEDRPLWLGSVKSNIGHTQAAAGVAGVIKMVMALRHGELPATLHVDEPSGHVDWSSGAVRLLTEPVAWPRGERPRRAAVSSFGISGTNAHLVLEEVAEDEDVPAKAHRPREAGRGAAGGAVLPWVVSGRSATALREQAARLAEFVAAHPDATATQVGRALVTTRAVFEHRAVVVGRDRAALTAGLGALATGEASPDVVSGVAGDVGPGPVLVFPGQGSQWAGMGAQLLDESPVFAARIGECEQALSAYVDWTLTDVLRGDGSELSRVEVVQPVLWAVMVSLAAVWADHGVTPAAVVGHSQGEIAAAVVAGALTLDDGAKIVALRSQALRQLSGGGAMASLGVGQEQAAQLIAGQDGVGVAAVNGPSSTVISGPPEQVAAVVADAEERGLRGRVIDVDYASHSPQVDAIADELTRTLAGVRPVAAPMAFYSAVTGTRVDTTGLDTDYWITNLRQPVRFADAVGALLADGHRVFVESSSHPVLTLGLQETFEEAGAAAVTVPTLRRDDGGLDRLTLSLAQAFGAGCAVRWEDWFPAAGASGVELPTYAFQRRRYWLEAPAGGQDVAGLGLAAAGHPLLGAAAELADDDVRLLTGRIGRHSHPWLAQHTLFGTPVVPASVLAEWALRAADEAGCAGVEDLTLRAPLTLPEDAGVQVQIVVGPADARDGHRELHVYARPEDAAGPDGGGAPWTCHADGQLVVEPVRAATGGPTGPAVEGSADEAWPPAGAEPVDLTGFYERAADAGVGYGPAYTGVRAVWRRGAELFAEAALPQEAPDAAGFGIHPALLDAALHPALLGDRPVGREGGDTGKVWMPFALTGVSLWATGATSVRVRLTPLDDEPAGTPGEGGRTWRVAVSDPAGAEVLTCEGLVLVAAGARDVRAAGGRVSDLYELQWVPGATVPASGAGADGARPGGASGWAVLGEGGYESLGALVAAVEGGVPPVPSAVLVDVPVADAGFVGGGVGADGAVGTADVVDTADTSGAAGAAEVGEEVRAGLAAARWADDLVERWAGDARFADVPLVFVTRGAVAVGDGRLPVPAVAAVRGVVEAARSTYPGRFLLVDTGVDGARAGEGGPGSDLEHAVGVALAADEPQLALRAGDILVPRLAVTGVADDEGRALDPDGTLLIVGSAGSAGPAGSAGAPMAAVAEHLVRAGECRHLLLLSDSHAEASGATELEALVRELSSGDATVRVIEADPSDPAALTEALAATPPDHPLTGVIHVTAAAPTAGTPAPTFAEAWAASAGVTAALYRAAAQATSGDRPLALFAVLSPAGASVGVHRSAADAAADAFREALALRRHCADTTGVALAYGPPSAPASVSDRGPSSHIKGTPPGRIPTLLDAARAHGGRPLFGVRPAFGGALAGEDAAALPAPLRALAAARPPARRTAADRRPPTDWSARLAGLSAAEQLRLLVDAVRAHAAAVLGRTDPAALRGDATFKQLGLDSLTSVELRNRLVEDTGLRLPTALVFRHPTPAALAGHLRERLTGPGESTGTRASGAPGRVTVDAPPGAGSVLSDLTRMENALAALTGESSPLSHGETDEITTRLEALLTRWRATNTTADEDDGAADRLKGASADQIFDFIDNELGVGHDTSRATPTPKAG